jgi:hypothetical protein
VSFTNLKLDIKKGSEEDLTVRADLNGSASTQHKFGITEIDSSAADVNGLPVYGNTMTLASVTVGNVTIMKRTIASTDVNV